MVTRDKEGHFVMIEGLIHQEDINIVNVYAPDIGSPKYIKQILTYVKGEIDKTTIMVRDIDTLQWIDHPDRKSTRK